jgi:heavy metal-binding protein
MFRASVLLSITLGLGFAHTATITAWFQQSPVYVCPMHPEVQSSTKGRCPKCEMELVADKSVPASSTAAETSDGYTCSMHPEIRTPAPGKCPKCEMVLIPVIPSIIEDFDLRIESSPLVPRPKEKVKLRFRIFNPKTNEQVKQFQVMHEKLFHLFIVSQDLAEFQHIHPDLQPDGSFTIETTLERAGRYKVYSDIYPADGVPQVLQASLKTAGASSDLFLAEPKLESDRSLSKTADGMKIELKLEPVEVIAGRPTTLKYHITDAVTGTPVKDITPYLGAWGHTLILSADQSDYVHSHPEEQVDSADRAKLRGGPNVTFQALFPRPGLYRIWTQFLRGDTLTTVSFTVRAARLH